jgi:hypothetical protein
MGNILKTEIVPPKVHAIAHIIFGIVVVGVGILLATTGHPVAGCIAAIAAVSIAVNGWLRLQRLRVQK